MRAGRVAVLNGGFPAWVGEGLPLDESPADEAELAAPALAARSPPADTRFHACLQAHAPRTRTSKTLVMVLAQYEWIT